MNFYFILDNGPYLLRGLGTTLLLSAISLLGSVIIGVLLASLRLSRNILVRSVAVFCIDIVRLTPLIMVIFWFFFFLPIVSGQKISSLTAAIVALVVFNSSYMAEIFRAGILAVPRGLVEASRSTGMTARQCFLNIVLPIAVRYVLPALINRFVALIMGTSLVYVIGVTELFRSATNINNRIFRPYEVYIMVAVIYFVLCYSLSLAATYLRSRMA